jgi:hypothetical protein
MSDDNDDRKPDYNKTDEGWWAGPILWTASYPTTFSVSVDGKMTDVTVMQQQFQVSTPDGISPPFYGKVNPLLAELYFRNPSGSGAVFLRYDFPAGRDDFQTALDILSIGGVPHPSGATRVIYGNADDLPGADYLELGDDFGEESSASPSDGSSGSSGSVRVSGSSGGKGKDPDGDDELDRLEAEERAEDPEGGTTVEGRLLDMEIPDWVKDAAGGSGGGGNLYIPWGDADWEEMQRKKGPLGPTVLWLTGDGAHFDKDGAQVANQMMLDGLQR